MQEVGVDRRLRVQIDFRLKKINFASCEGKGQFSCKLCEYKVEINVKRKC